MPERNYKRLCIMFDSGLPHSSQACLKLHNISSDSAFQTEAVLKIPIEQYRDFVCNYGIADSF